MIASSVSKKIQYLVVGENFGQKKEKAEELIKKGHNIKIIDIDELEAML